LANKELKRPAQTTQVLQLIALAAALSVSKAEEGEKTDADGSFSFEIIVIYTLLVIFLTLVAQRLYWMLQYGEPNSSYDGVFFELNLEVTPMMLWRKMSHLEEIALNLWWKKVPLPREEKIQDMSLRNQLNDAPRSNRNAPQPDPEPESPRPTSSQSADLTNALAALRVHGASMPDYEAE